MRLISYVVHGFGGLVQVLVSWSEERNQIDDCTMAELEKWLDQLKRVVDMQHRLKQGDK